jgi:1-acyl-sn-glycerol-3-phosphate acyltransferase
MLALFKLFFRIRVEGLKNVPGTPVIICANHLGWADPFMVLLLLPLEPRIYVLGLHPGRISKFRAWVVNSLRVIVPLERDKPWQALRTAEEIIKRGGSVLIFPEGELGDLEGSLLDLQPGAAHMSLMCNTPILPAGLTGTSSLWLGRRLTLRLGRPINPDAFEGTLRERGTDITARLRHEMCELLPGDTQRSRIKLLRNFLTKLL